MRDEKTIFEGGVRIYLQGKGALQPFAIKQKPPFQYYIGSPISKIIVIDHRQEPTNAANIALSYQSKNDFAEVFNQPASASVKKEIDEVTIELKDCNEQGKFPILWMGVIYDGKMPVHKIFWEELKPIGPNETAFAVLVEG